jgi:hypothetical protein
MTVGATDSSTRLTRPKRRRPELLLPLLPVFSVWVVWCYPVVLYDSKLKGSGKGERETGKKSPEGANGHGSAPLPLSLPTAATLYPPTPQHPYTVTAGGRRNHTGARYCAGRAGRGRGFIFAAAGRAKQARFPLLRPPFAAHHCTKPRPHPRTTHILDIHTNTGKETRKSKSSRDPQQLSPSAFSLYR